MAERPFVVDPVLTGIAIGYRNDANSYIADKALPRSPVMGEKFKWTHYPIAEAFNVPDGRVGRLGRVPQLEFGGQERTDSVEDYGFDAPIPNSDIDAAARARDAGLSNHDPEGHAVMSITDTLANIRELRVAAIMQNPATYAPTRRIQLTTSASRFDDYANSDPIGVFKAGFDATLVKRPNTCTMGRPLWSKLSSHPHLVNAVKGNVTSKGVITPEQFVELFSGEGLKELLIGDTWFNAARPGQQTLLRRAWGNHISLTHIDPMASPESGGITFGLTAQFGSKIAGRIEDPNVGLQGGFQVRVGERVKELVVAQDVGYLIQDAIL